MKRIPSLFLKIALPFLFPACLFSQGLLHIDTTYRCIFTNKFFGEELYAFNPDPGVEAMVVRILTASDHSRNFRLVNTNVANVAAIVDKADRYLLYNSEFFLEHQSDTALRFAIITHEIGHLINLHTLSSKKRIREESEADRFTGQVMRALDFSLNKALLIADFPGYSYISKPEERKKTIRRAWEETDAQLRSGQSAGYLNEETLKNLPIPVFPWPPPQCARRSTIDNGLFAHCKLLQDVDMNLSKALDDSRYGQRSYYYVPDGFCRLLHSLKQYKADGSLMAESDRWKDFPVPEDADWTSVFSSILYWLYRAFSHFRIYCHRQALYNGYRSCN